MDKHNDSCAAYSHQLVLSVLNPDGRPLPAGLLAEHLRAITGVRYAYVSAQTEMIWLIYDTSCFDLADVVSALAVFGYTAGPPELRDLSTGLYRFSEQP
jgi:hypothetical protein